MLPGKKTALIANAIDFGDEAERRQKVNEEVERLESLGLTVTEIDLREYFNGRGNLETELAKYDLIWVRGGNVFVLRRACKQSGADTIIKEMLENDTVAYGGYSAGIDLLTPNLHGAELVDDPNIVPEGYDKEIVWDCLGILPYSVAPHYKSDHPESESVGKSVEYMINNHIPFIALRDGEAIVINGSSQEIVQ